MGSIIDKGGLDTKALFDAEQGAYLVKGYHIKTNAFHWAAFHRAWGEAGIWIVPSAPAPSSPP